MERALNAPRRGEGSYTPAGELQAIRAPSPCAVASAPMRGGGGWGREHLRRTYASSASAARTSKPRRRVGSGNHRPCPRTRPRSRTGPPASSRRGQRLRRSTGSRRVSQAPGRRRGHRGRAGDGRRRHCVPRPSDVRRPVSPGDLAATGARQRGCEHTCERGVATRSGSPERPPACASAPRSSVVQEHARARHRGLDRDSQNRLAELCLFRRRARERVSGTRRPVSGRARRRSSMTACTPLRRGLRTSRTASRRRPPAGSGSERRSAGVRPGRRAPSSA